MADVIEVFDGSTALIEVIVVGPAGTSGVANVVAPLSYNAGTQTVSTSMATGRLLGRSSAGTGVAEEITVGANLTLSAGVLSASGGGGSLSDGDKGDITVTGSGTVWTIDAGAVNTTKLGGDITTAGKALLDDASAAAQRTTLGLGGAATLNVGTAAGTVAAGDDSRITGALSAATAATTYQPLDADLTSIAALTTTAFGRSLLTQADAAAARTTIGAGTGTVTGVTATGPITSSGGTAPVISTSMATSRLLGRTTAGTGVAEEISVGSSLTLASGSLSVTGLSVASGKTLTANNSVTLAGTDSTTMTFPATSQTLAGLGTAQTFTALQTINLAGEQLALGAAGANSGVMSFSGSTSGKITLQAAAAAGTYTLTLPTTAGTSGQFLQTDGTGVLTWATGSGGGGTPGGSNTQIQFNNSGVFGGASGLTTNGTELTIASGTKTASAPFIDATQTWNNSGVTFTGFRFNATDTASASLSLLLDLQVGGSSRVTVRKDGLLTSSFTINSASVTAIANTGVYIGGNNPVQWTNGASYFNTSDLFIRRRGAANLAMGAADAAAPVAQTLSVQSVVAGTSNTAGANFTITGSQGTGSGAGGSIIFQVAPAGGSSTAQNALATALTLAASKVITVADTFDLAFSTGTGTKIATATTQKIGFWNATPIVQPTTAVAAATVAATGTGDVVAASTTFDGYTIPQIVKALRNAGLLA